MRGMSPYLKKPDGMYDNRENRLLKKLLMKIISRSYSI